jgi:hypothetical protein
MKAAPASRPKRKSGADLVFRGRNREFDGSGAGPGRWTSRLAHTIAIPAAVPAPLPPALRRSGMPQAEAGSGLDWREREEQHHRKHEQPDYD